MLNHHPAQGSIATPRVIFVIRDTEKDLSFPNNPTAPDCNDSKCQVFAL